MIKKIGDLRKSQTISTFGPGAIVDFPNFSGIIAGIDDWTIPTDENDSENGFKIIYDKNLQALFGKDYFIQPSSDDQQWRDNNIRAYRFPEWYYCPTCHRLDRYSNFMKAGALGKNEKVPTCHFCKHGTRLVPSRFMVTCLNGHLSDFPYVWWVHRDHECSGQSPELYLKYSGNTGGLESIKIHCKTCGATTTMAGCMGKEALAQLKCKGEMPWFGYNHVEKKDRYSRLGKSSRWHIDSEDRCEAKVVCVQRSANNVYYPSNESALTIPPCSRKKYQQVEKCSVIIRNGLSSFENVYSDCDICKVLDERKANVENIFNHAIKNSGKFDGSFSEFFNILRNEVFKKNEELTVGDIRYKEYLTFCGGDIDENDLRTEEVDIPEMYKPYFSKIVKVKKLREVTVLTGFTRVVPKAMLLEERKKDTKHSLFNREQTPISKNVLCNWLPAVELYGEGIFLALDEKVLKQWETKVIKSGRYNSMEAKYREAGCSSYLAKDMFNKQHPRYVLLHSLSHLLIRSISAQCGYATASIKERIYSSYIEDKKDMCGILIYTSTTDTDGSLGGLVRQGNTNFMKDLMDKMLHESSWCSNDPLCIESKAQGYSGLNYAACHACTLLPETSCESLNCLLDRAAVVGYPDDLEISYFSDLLKEVM